MAAGKLRESRVITDFNQRIVFILPVGFYLNDECREGIGAVRFRAQNL
jgi:hypothetical protein